MLKLIVEHRNRHLLFTLIIFFIMLPFLDDSKISGLCLTVFLSLILFFAVMAAGSGKKIFRISLILGVIALASGWSNIPYIQTGASIVASKIAFCLFFGFISAVILHRIFHTEVVTPNTIYGAACVYILLGLCWALIYNMIEFLHPGSFSLPDRNTIVGIGRNHALFMDFFYFSFTTITTLGYGDILPVSKTVKMLSVLESLIGQLFIALLVARLVGLYTAQQHSRIEKQHRSE